MSCRPWGSTNLLVVSGLSGVSVWLWLCCTCLEDGLCRVWSIYPFLGMLSLGCNSLELSMTGIFLPCAQIGEDSPVLPCARRGQKRCGCNFFVHELPVASLGSSLGWVCSSSELPQPYRCCAICPAQTAKFIFLSSSCLPKITCPTMLCGKVAVPVITSCPLTLPVPCSCRPLSPALCQGKC